MKRSMRVLYASLLIALSPFALAQTSGNVDTLATTLDATAANRGQAQVAGRIASSFANLAGSESNALALVNALRNGTNATLTYAVPPPTGTTPPATTPPATPPPPTTTTVTYDPPTGKMGWGNVKIALALAQDTLARAGITRPTAEQLQAALNGGSVTVKNPDGTTTTTTLKGVLQMRANGMGWGQIAHSSGTKLGPVVSGLKTTQAKIAALPAKGSVSTATSGPGVVTSKGATASSKGIVTATGVAASPSQGKGALHSANAPGRGMVTAAGGGASVGAASGASHGRGAGVVTAAGGPATPVTTAHGGGNGNGNSADKGKGNGRGGGG